MDNWWEEDERVTQERAPATSAQPSASQAGVEDNWWEADRQIEVKQELDGGAISRGLSRGADMAGQFYGSTLESIGKGLGIESLEESGRARALRNRAELQSSTPSMTTEDIDGVGSLGSFVGEKLGETALPMGVTIGAGIATGAALGSFAPGIGNLAGALIGGGVATLANLPYMFGAFRERQKDADIEAGRPIEVDEGTALLYALPASSLDAVSDLFLVGKLAKAFKPLLGSSSLLTRVTTNAATGATVESLTEVGQTVLERAQAGLSLTDEDAQREYFEAAVAGGLVGGAVRGTVSIRKPTPEVEQTNETGADAAQRAALRDQNTRTEASDVAPDQAAALTGADPVRAKLAEIRARRAQRLDPAAGPSTLPTPTQVAGAQVANPAPAATSVGSPPTAAPVPPVSAPVAEQVTPVPAPAPVAAPVVPPPADAPVIEGTALNEEVPGADTALNEEVPGAVASGDTIPTVPEAPETLAAQASALMNWKDKRKAMYIPPEALGEVDSDVLPTGKRVASMLLPNGGMLFWNKNKIDLGKKAAEQLYNSGNLGQLLGLGPFNKSEVAASGGTQDLAIVERNPEGVPVKEVGATEVTAPEQIQALEAERTEGNTIEVVPAAQALAERAESRSEKVKATSKARSKKPKEQPKEQPAVRTKKDFDPEEIARIEAAANAKPEPKSEVTSTGKRIIRLGTDAGTRAKTEEFNRGIAERASKLASVSDGDALASDELSSREQKRAAANRGEIKSPAEEVRARLPENSKLGEEEINRRIGQAERAARILERRGPKSENAGGLSDLEALEERLTAALDDAKAANISLGSDVSDVTPNAIAWLMQARETRKQIGKLKKARTKDTREAYLASISEFLGAELILAETGSSIELRSIRKAVGEGIRAVSNTVAGADGENDLIANIVDDQAPIEEQIDNLRDGLDQPETEVETEARTFSEGDSVLVTLGKDDTEAGVIASGPKMRGERPFYRVRFSDGANQEFPADQITPQGNVESVADSEPEIVTVHRAQRKGSSGTGVGEAAFGIGRYWSSVLDVAEKYRDIVVPVTIIGPKGRAEINRRDAMNTPGKMLEALRKVGLEAKDRGPIIRVLAGEPDASLPEGARLEVGDSEIIEQQLDISKFVRQTAQARYNEFDLRNPEDVAVLKAQGIEGTIYEEDGVTNYVEFPDTPQGNTLATRRDGRDDADQEGIIPRDGSEERLATRSVTLDELRNEVFSAESLANFVGSIRNFTAMQKKLQRLLGKRMYDALLDVVGDVPVHILPDAYFEMYAPNADAYYNPNGDYIAVRDSVMRQSSSAMHAVLHEGSHAAFHHAIKKSPVFRAQLARLLSLSREHATKTGVDPKTYGLTNIDEFLSEAWSNPKFQEFLATVPIQEGAQKLMNVKPSDVGVIRSVLDWVKSKLADMLGIRQALNSAGYKDNTVSGLEAALEVAGRVLEASPRARQEYYNSDARYSDDALPMERGVDPDSIEGRLRARGVDSMQSRNIAAMIDEELDGTATDEELDAIVGALGKPVASQQGLTGPSPFMPPKLPGRVAKLLGMDGVPKAGPMNRALLYVMTLDFIDLKFRKFFGDKAGNALSDYVNAAFKYRKVADDVAATHDVDFADFEDLRRSKPAEAKKIQDLVAMLEALDINISAGATNDHLKKTNARKYLQSKRALPEVQRLLASMEPETRALVRRMAENFTKSHDDYIRSVTYTILEGLETKLSNSDLMRIIDHTVDGKLDAQDKADVNNDEVFALLERSEFLKKRKGSYFPAERFGEYVVTTSVAIQDPKITSVVTKSSRQRVPVRTEIDGGTIRFTFDHTIRGARPAAVREIYNWVAGYELPLRSYVVKYRDRQTGQIVNKGEMDITRDYDMVHEIAFQNEGVHFFEDPADARGFQAQAAKDKAAGKLLRTSTVLERHAQRHHEYLIPPGALEAVFRSIDSSKKLAGNDTRKQQLKNAVKDAVVRNMVGNRYEKRLMGRQNILGASDEVGRAAAYYGRAVGNAIANIRSGGERAAAMQRMRDVADAKKDDDEGGIISQVVNEVIRREDLDMGPTANNQILDNLSTLNAVDKLFSPANWFLNMTQVPLNLLPYLGGKFGNVKAGRSIMSAYQRVNTGTALKSGLKNTGKSITQVGKSRIDMDDVLGSIRKNVGVKYQDLFDSLIETGDITDNVGIENAAQLAGGRSAFGTALVKMDRAMRAMPNAIEAINRSVVSVAAYDLALASGMSKQDSIKYAREAVRRTQFRYDEVNKSMLMRKNPALRFFFTFKQFGQGQYQMLADALGRALKDATPQERAQARKQLYTMFAMQALAAGAFSLPAIELAKTAMMVGALLGLGEGWDREVDELRGLMKESMGQPWEEIVSKGLLSKALGVDLSSRMSWADLILGYPPRSGEKQDVTAWVGNLVMGPQGGLVYDMFIGGPKAIIAGDFARGLNLMLPLKAVSDAAKATGAGMAGTMDPLDATKQVLGFQSLRQARINDETGARIRENAIKKRTEGDLISDYLNAINRGDVARATAAIREYNRNLPEGARQISLTGLERRRRENVRRYAE